MTDERNRVAVIDDDPSVREALPDLLREAGYAVESFASAESFLTVDPARFGCLLVDVAMPGMSGPELQEYLARQDRQIPLVFITANADPAMRARLMQLGAVDCLIKPFSEESLLAALSAAARRG